MTLETQKPGPGADDPSVFTSLIHKEHESLRAAKKRGDRAALLTAWLARQDLLELRNGAMGESPERVVA